MRNKGKANAGSFKKNDPRIYKGGRPRVSLFSELRAETLETLQEPTEYQGQTMTRLKSIILQQAQDIAGQRWLIEMAFGNVRDHDNQERVVAGILEALPPADTTLKIVVVHTDTDPISNKILSA